MCRCFQNRPAVPGDAQVCQKRSKDGQYTACEQNQPESQIFRGGSASSKKDHHPHGRRHKSGGVNAGVEGVHVQENMTSMIRAVNVKMFQRIKRPGIQRGLNQKISRGIYAAK